MTVFVAQFNGGRDKNNIGDAKRFGDIEIINAFYVHGDELIEGTPPGAWVVPPVADGPLWRAAKRFNPNADYLLLAGDHLQMVLFTAKLATLHPWFNVLRWDRQIRAYLPVRITP